MPLFHCTIEDYQPETVIGPYSQSRFHTKQQNGGHAWLENILEQCRPVDQPCGRENAVYASDTRENAAIFLEGQYRGADSKPTFYCYEVRADIYSKAPMSLIRSLEFAKQDADKTKKIALEYWLPKSNWRYWEYFAPSMTVVRRVDWPLDGSAARTFYAADRELAKRLGM
jgi:hypothetical protein